jgi:hypothetical protein
MPGHRPTGLAVIDADADRVARRAAGGDHRDGQAGGAEDVANDGGFAQGRRQDHALDAGGQQVLQLLLGWRMTAFAAHQDQARPALVASSNTPTRKSLMKAALGLE